MPNGEEDWLCTLSRGFELGNFDILFWRVVSIANFDPNFLSHNFLILHQFSYPRARKDYWENLKPATGRPSSASMSSPDAWGVTQGTEDLYQHEAATTKDELQKVFSKKMTGIANNGVTTKAM